MTCPETACPGCKISITITAKIKRSFYLFILFIYFFFLFYIFIIVKLKLGSVIFLHHKTPILRPPMRNEFLKPKAKFSCLRVVRCSGLSIPVCPPSMWVTITIMSQRGRTLHSLFLSSAFKIFSVSDQSVSYHEP